MAEPTTLSLLEGELVEFAALWVRPGKEGQLGAYFAQALPIAIRHGARPLASFQPVHVYRGELKPTSLFLAVWPSPGAFQATFAVPELKPLLPIRDAALEKALLTHFRAHFESDGH